MMLVRENALFDLCQPLQHVLGLSGELIEIRVAEKMSPIRHSTLCKSMRIDVKGC
jgi:hypothetical protein